MIKKLYLVLISTLSLSFQATSKEMGGTGVLLKPKKSTTDYHNRKYRVFLQMLEDQRNYKQIMEK